MNSKPITINIKEKERITWIWIKQRLALLDSSFLKIASLHNITQATLSHVKHLPYPMNERRIAYALGLEPWDLWPERYNADHKPARISTRYHGGHAWRNEIIRNQMKRNGKNQSGDSHETQV